MNYERLAFAEKLENRDIGLVEIASIVGLPLDVAGKRVIRNKMNDTESESQSFNQNDADSEMDYILAPVSEPIKEAAFQAIIKCERRQTCEYRMTEIMPMTKLTLCSFLLICIVQ